jgi:non-homologous end joining protein Ku
LPPGIDTTRKRQDEFVAGSPDDRRRPDRQRARIDEIPDEKVPKDTLELASHIVESKSGHFEPEKFEDHYEDALKELLRKKSPVRRSKDRSPKRACASQSHQSDGSIATKR